MEMTKENETLTVNNVEQIEEPIPQISDDEIKHIEQNNKEIVTVDKSSFILRTQENSESNRYLFISGVFRTVPKMNKFPIGTTAAERKTAKVNPYDGLILKYSRSLGVIDFDYAKKKAIAAQKLGLSEEEGEAKERAWGKKIGDSSIVAHSFEGTDITRGYISYNPQRFYDSYYVWANTSERLTDTEVDEMKTYMAEREAQIVNYCNYRIDSIVWLNTRGKHLIIKENAMLSDAEYLTKYLEEKEIIKASKANKKAPKL
jgi:hypothetical protein